jgi:hypothetical protein
MSRHNKERRQARDGLLSYDILYPSGIRFSRAGVFQTVRTMTEGGRRAVPTLFHGHDTPGHKAPVTVLDPRAQVRQGGRLVYAGPSLFPGEDYRVAPGPVMYQVDLYRPAADACRDRLRDMVETYCWQCVVNLLAEGAGVERALRIAREQRRHFLPVCAACYRTLTGCTLGPHRDLRPGAGAGLHRPGFVRAAADVARSATRPLEATESAARPQEVLLPVGLPEKEDQGPLSSSGAAWPRRRRRPVGSLP